MSDFQLVISVAGDVQSFCQSRKWRFCFIGGIAVHRWGEPRFTQDVDLTLLTGFGSEAAFIDAFLTQFPARTRSARQFALDHRVLLATSPRGVDIDVALGAYPFEEDAIRRASPWLANDTTTLITCSAEDLIIQKVFAARDRDWGDVEGVLARQHGTLDLARIRRELPPLLELKEDPESFGKFEQLASSVNRRLTP
jgi:hypothetical protein